MAYYRTTVTFFRRRRKPIIVFLFIVFLYGLIQSFGEIRTATKVHFENDWYRSNGAKSQQLFRRNQSSDLKREISLDSLQVSGPNHFSLFKVLFNDGNSSDAFKDGYHEHCKQKYQTEADVEFNTFEILKHVVASNEQLPNGISRSKYNASKLQVFFLPMTHVDPGWLKTFANYCKDTNSILNNLHKFLKEHPKMRFMWCEIAFFEVWWSGINETVKADIRNMVLSGQLEIASGSWVMSDEANPYFVSSVDNIIEGQQFVLNELGVKPTVIWSNDPFGYGPSLSYLFAKTGIRRAVINRIHNGIKKYLQSKRAIPFFWRQHFDSRGDNDVLTQVLPFTHYDILNSCGPDQSVCCQFDFKRITHFSCPGAKPVPITEANKAAKAEMLKKQLIAMSKMYESNVLLVMWGDDFRYDMLEEWHQQYDNLMPLFELLNSKGDIDVKFGTFNDYFNALEKFYKLKNLLPATLSGDFFPYQCALGDHWTGYYTTRPFFKKLERQLHAMVYTADLMTLSFSYLLSNDAKLKIDKQLTYARRNLALFQHHDAITGTSKKHVMKDYAILLHNSMVTVNEVLQQTQNELFNTSFKMNKNSKSYDEMWSQNLINLSAGDKILVNVWNSLTHKQKTIITLRVSTANVIVEQGKQQIIAQIEPYFDINKARYTSDFQLIFAVNLQPLSNNLYTVKYNESPTTVLAQIYAVSSTPGQASMQYLPKNFVSKLIPAEKFRIKTERLKTTHNLNTGLLETFDSIGTQTIKLTQDFVAHEQDSGGAYIMRFTGVQHQLPLSNLSRYIFEGPVRQRIVIHSEILHQWLSANVGDDVEDEFLDIDLRVDIRHFCDFQLVTTFNTSLDPATTEMFTDSNGMQLIKREYHHSLDAAANYYPMPTVFMLQDQNIRLSIVSDLEHGARVYGSAGAEIMLDRIMCRDDGKGLGVGEDSVPNDIRPVTIGFTVVAESMKNSSLPIHYAYNTAAAHRALQKRLYPPTVMISRGTFQKSKNVPLSLPCDVQIVSSRSLNATRKLLILHRLGTDCSSTIALSSCSALSLQVALKQYLKSINITKVQRTNLSGTDVSKPVVNADDLQINIEPMDFVAIILYIG